MTYHEAIARLMAIAGRGDDNGNPIAYQALQRTAICGGMSLMAFLTGYRAAVQGSHLVPMEKGKAQVYVLVGAPLPE